MRHEQELATGDLAPGFRLCGCCAQAVANEDWDGLYGACCDCAFCQSLGQCYDGEDKPENTVCCHGKRCERKASELPDAKGGTG